MQILKNANTLIFMSVNKGLVNAAIFNFTTIQIVIKGNVPKLASYVI